MSKKKVIKPINYTARDFTAIKEELVNYAKRYYPDTFKDFSNASFGSLMLDTVSYVGDMLSYYVDYQANESFISTANERKNIIKLARQAGYKYTDTFSSSGKISLYILVPSGDSLGPDPSYFPTLREGSTFKSTAGSSYILSEDVNFNNPKNEIVAARVNESTGLPTYYAVRATGNIISGQIKQQTFSLGEYQKFLKLNLEDTDIVEIISIFDADGNEYYQVGNLSQDTVYQAVTDPESSGNNYSQTMLPLIVPRRFIFEFDGENYYIQFGAGSENEIFESPIADPSSIVLKQVGRNYVSDQSIDPSKLLDTDSLGVSPSNTTITVRYRKNSPTNVNAPASTIRTTINKNLTFDDITVLDKNIVAVMFNSLECTNDEPIVGNTTLASQEEIRERAKSFFATQNRAVTEEDYKTIIYSMDSKFGSIKRCNIVVDANSFRKNLNLYVLSEDFDGKLSRTPETIKQNLRLWLHNYKMIGDDIDILDGKIVNLSVEFEVIADSRFSTSEIYASCIERIQEKIMNPLQMGEAFYVTKIYSELNKVQGVIDTKSVTLKNLTGGAYSEVNYDIFSNMSPDGRYLVCPANVTFEIKFPNNDIKGTVR